MSIEVFTREDLAGWIMGDLCSRRGRIERIAVDDREHVLAWLEKGVAEHEWDTVFSLGDAQYDSIRSDPRFQDIVRRTGLSQ